MNRPWRIQYPGAIYRAISRCNIREDILIDNEDRLEFFSCIAGAVERFMLHFAAHFFLSPCGVSAVNCGLDVTMTADLKNVSAMAFSGGIKGAREIMVKKQ